MIGSSDGIIYRWMSFSKSHGLGVKVVIDGCPSGLELSIEDIEVELDRRRPASSSFVSDRNEGDKIRFYRAFLKERQLAPLLRCR